MPPLASPMGGINFSRGAMPPLRGAVKYPDINLLIEIQINDIAICTYRNFFCNTNKFKLTFVLWCTFISATF